MRIRDDLSFRRCPYFTDLQPLDSYPLTNRDLSIITYTSVEGVIFGAHSYDLHVYIWTTFMLTGPLNILTSHTEITSQINHKSKIIFLSGPRPAMYILGL